MNDSSYLFSRPLRCKRGPSDLFLHDLRICDTFASNFLFLSFLSLLSVRTFSNRDNIDLILSTSLLPEPSSINLFTQTMLPSLLRSLFQLGRTWKPLNFSNPKFAQTSASPFEEAIPGYIASRYHPTIIGEILKEQYQVVGKLGYGASSTAWLAGDMK